MAPFSELMASQNRFCLLGVSNEPDVVHMTSYHGHNLSLHEDRKDSQYQQPLLGSQRSQRLLQLLEPQAG